MTASIYGADGVAEIIAGPGISVSPTSGLGVVTITATYANAGGVVAFNDRVGAVYLTSSDVTNALGFVPINNSVLADYAPIASPHFSGVPTTPTPATSDNSTGVATTAFVRSAITAYAPGGGTGTVTSASVVSANGFSGSVANSTTTPAITLTTSVTGVLKGSSSALVAATAGTDYSAPSGVETLTNKRITPRVGSTTSSATPTINTDTYDIYKLTAQAVDITSFTTNLSGTPTDGQCLILEITGTAARAITWGASFEASTVALPTTTVTTAMLAVAFLWNAVTSKWRCVGVA